MIARLTELCGPLVALLQVFAWSWVALLFVILIQMAISQTRRIK
jgi:hypothetical protein